MGFGLFLIFLIPCLLLIISLIITKRVNVSTITIVPNLVCLGFLILLDKIDLHSTVAKTITNFNLNVFNIVMIFIIIVTTFLNYVLGLKQTGSKSKTLINSIIYLIAIVAEVILIKIYYSCQ